MESIFLTEIYDVVVAVMAVLAVVVFVALQRVEAAYGMTYNSKWGPSFGNKIAWVLMELPAFLVMIILWATSPHEASIATEVMAFFFLFHYFQRTFIFPFLMRGKSRMPMSIMFMGMLFNIINAYMIGGWLFWVASPERYPESWLWSPIFLAGTLIFLGGMIINIHSDHVIRNLRKPGDTGHYIPYGGLYRYVTGANYFGEFVEWVGYAILTWSVAGFVFALWTFANLAPRAKTLTRKYEERFGVEYRQLHRHHIIPFLY